MKQSSFHPTYDSLRHNVSIEAKATLAFGVVFINKYIFRTQQFLARLVFREHPHKFTLYFGWMRPLKRV